LAQHPLDWGPPLHDNYVRRAPRRTRRPAFQRRSSLRDLDRASSQAAAQAAVKSRLIASMRRVSNFHDPLEFAETLPEAMVNSLEGLVFGKKRRAFSSFCIFLHGLGLVAVGSYYVAFPAESLEILSDAWAVDLHAKGSDDAFALARNLMAVAAIYLAVWGLTCCALAWVGSPSAKRIVAALNLVAALLVAACSAYHPEAVAAPRCRRDAEAAAACMKLALTWHTPFIVCDVLGILFADAGPRLLRVDDKSAILVDGNVTDAMRNARITKIDSRADLVEYASSEILDTHERLVPKVDSRTAKDYRYLTSPIKNPLPCEKRSFTPIADPKKMK